MFYLVTYATHEERYFKFLKNRVHRVLGFGDKWNGFYGKAKAVSQFCDSIDPDDIVCCVDGFDSIVLGTDQEILNAYRSIGHEIVFSKEKNLPDHAIVNYTMTKQFGKACLTTKLNAGLYIGKAKTISDFWRDLQPGEDDQKYACVKNPYVDIENRLFYNYTKLDTDVTQDTEGNIFKGDKKILIIGMPGNETIRGDVDVTPKYLHLMKTYYKSYIPEIVILCIIILFIYIRCSRKS